MTQPQRSPPGPALAWSPRRESHLFPDWQLRQPLAQLRPVCTCGCSRSSWRRTRGQCGLRGDRTGAREGKTVLQFVNGTSTACARLSVLSPASQSGTLAEFATVPLFSKLFSLLCITKSHLKGCEFRASPLINIPIPPPRVLTCGNKCPLLLLHLNATCNGGMA